MNAQPPVLTGLREIKLRGPYGRAHGDCGACEIYHDTLAGSATDGDIEQCQECYLSGKTIDHERMKSVLSDLACDGRDVTMPNGLRLPAAQALRLLDEEPESKLSVTITF